MGAPVTPSSSASVRPLTTDSGRSATTSEPGRASSSRRLIEQPLRLRARPRALEGEAAAQLLAVQDEDGVAAVERLRPGDAPALLVGALVPDDHAAVAERALEGVVAHPVVLDLDGEALCGRVEGGALGHRPGPHHAVDLQAQVVVVRRRLVLLHDEDAGADAADPELLVPLDARVARRTAPSPRYAISASSASGAPSAWSSRPVGRTQPSTPSPRACAATASASRPPSSVRAHRPLARSHRASVARSAGAGTPCTSVM